MAIQSEMPTCKYCGSKGVVKFGKYKGVQLYWCKACQRKFKAEDTLFHMKTPTNQVSSALNAYYEGMSIKAIRRHLQLALIYTTYNNYTL